MRIPLCLAVLVLSACSGSSTAIGPVLQPVASPTPGATATGANSQTASSKAQFSIVVPPANAAATTATGTRRKPDFVSAKSLSVTIALVSVNGAPPASPASTTTAISGSACTVATPCSVSGPPVPPGSADGYTLTTYDTSGGTGNALDTATVNVPPMTNPPTTVSVTLLGIPASFTFANVPSNFHANTQNQTATLAIGVLDHSGQTIVGTYANSVTVTDPDIETTNGTSLTGTNVGSGCTTTCVILKSDADAVKLAYGGLAENAVTLTASATNATSATATFTPLLNAITSATGSSQTVFGTGGDGIDLFTTLTTSPVGYSGTITYGELGFTNSPYSKSLALTGANACSTFATVTIASNVATATSVASPAIGSCTVGVTDNLTDQTNANPVFHVTYTTSVVKVQAQPRNK